MSIDVNLPVNEDPEHPSKEPERNPAPDQDDDVPPPPPPPKRAPVREE